MVAHFEMFRDMWSSEASVQMESMVCWSSEVLSKVVRGSPAVMSSTYFQRLGAEAATWFTMARNTTRLIFVPCGMPHIVLDHSDSVS